MFGRIFQNERGGANRRGRRKWSVSPLFEMFGEKGFDLDD